MTGKFTYVGISKNLDAVLNQGDVINIAMQSSERYIFDKDFYSKGMYGGLIRINKQPFELICKTDLNEKGYVVVKELVIANFDDAYNISSEYTKNDEELQTLIKKNFDVNSDVVNDSYFGYGDWHFKLYINKILDYDTLPNKEDLN